MKPEPVKPPTPSYNGIDEEPPLTKKKKRVIDDGNIEDRLIAKMKKAKTVKALLEEKRVQEQPTKIAGNLIVLKSNSFTYIPNQFCYIVSFFMLLLILASLDVHKLLCLDLKFYN